MGRPPLFDSAPPQLVAEGRHAFGRYRQPIAEPSLGSSGLWRKLRTKEWHYHSVATDDWFLGLALVHLGYVASVFVYLVDRARGQKLEYEALSPFGRALSFAPSSVRGETTWRAGRDRISVVYSDGWHVELDVRVSSERLSGRLEVEPREALAVAFPLAPDRPAYTHKAAGMPARGRLSLAGSNIELNDAHATLDWTRSLARRSTRWKWASFAGRDAQGRRVGLNLSSDVYDEPFGESHENAAWIEGVTHDLSGVAFELPAHPEREPWRIKSRGSDEVDLAFHPQGARAQKLDLGLVRSDFVQPYGTFHGRIAPLGVGEPVALDGVFGVVENHFALW